MTILYILLFIFCLSVLIVVHELGHLTAAKIFKVYCEEFSIGFGPALIHKKRKGAETYFSLRAIPFGGYVSMVGEKDECTTNDGTPVPKERSLVNIAKWKRAIIMFAGVFMNAVLAIFVFYASNQFFPRETLYLRNINITENSIAEKAGLNSKDAIYIPFNEEDPNYALLAENIVVIDNNAYLSYEGGKDNVAVALDLSKTTYKNLTYAHSMVFYELDSEGKALLGKEITLSSKEYSSLDFTLTTGKYTNDEQGYISGFENKVSHSITVQISKDKKGNNVIEDFGLSVYFTKTRNSFGQAIKYTFSDFGESSVLIFKSIGMLFTSASAWKDVGGLISIGVVSSNTLANFGMAKFLWLWGMISVNLAIFNLLPFPGLDGWQILVLIVEAVAHKEIPAKVKNAVSMVGIILLFALMGFVLIKDIIGLF